MRKISLSPSIMCADLLNLSESVKALEKSNIDALHIDIIDGRFSPSIPLGFETVKKLRDVTELPFDIHIMATDNEWLIDEMLNVGVQQISFHHESSLHIDRLINKIKSRGVKVGVALNPATPISVLDCILPQLDCLLLMLINPGFAGDKNEKQVNYALNKIAGAEQKRIDSNLEFDIQVDGRVSLNSISSLVTAGATNLVLGSTSLYNPENSFEKNRQLLAEAVESGILNRRMKTEEHA